MLTDPMGPRLELEGAEERISEVGVLRIHLSCTLEISDDHRFGEAFNPRIRRAPIYYRLTTEGDKVSQEFQDK